MRLRGPKVLGGEWNTIWNYRNDAATRVEFKVPRSGRYGVFLTRNLTASASFTLECASATCARSSWGRELPANTLAIVAAGDTDLQPHKAPDNRFGGYKYQVFHLYTEMVEGIERFLDAGDLNLVNVETAIITACRTTAKRSNFKMHPAGLQTLARAGFDAFAMANNHAGDYREQGLRNSVAALVLAQQTFPSIGYAGIGAQKSAALKPFVYVRKGVRIAHASVGFGFKLKPSRP